MVQDKVNWVSCMELRGRPVKMPRGTGGGKFEAAEQVQGR